MAAGIILVVSLGTSGLMGVGVICLLAGFGLSVCAASMAIYAASKATPHVEYAVTKTPRLLRQRKEHEKAERLRRKLEAHVRDKVARKSKGFESPSSSRASFSAITGEKQPPSILQDI